MTFTARIRRSSPVWRHWIEQHLRRASLCSVPFIRTSQNDFVFDGPALEAHQITLMRGNPCVDLEIQIAGTMPVEAIVASDMIPETVITEALAEAVDTIVASDMIPEPTVYAPPVTTTAAAQQHMNRHEQAAGTVDEHKSECNDEGLMLNWTIPALSGGGQPVVTSYPTTGGPTKSGVLPADLRAYLQIPIQQWTNPPIPIDDTQTIIEWIRWAEDEIETDTNVRLCQTWIAAPAAKSVAEVSALSLNVANGYQQLGVDYDLAEAAYDFFFERWRDEGWGYQRMRWRPVKSVELSGPNLGAYDAGNFTGTKNVAFIYPLLNEYFRMPLTWVVEDQNRGLLRFVPATSVQMLPLFALQLTFMGFAQSVPGGLWFQY